MPLVARSDIDLLCHIWAGIKLHRWLIFGSPVGLVVVVVVLVFVVIILEDEPTLLYNYSHLSGKK